MGGSGRTSTIAIRADGGMSAMTVRGLVSGRDEVCCGRNEGQRREVLEVIGGVEGFNGSKGVKAVGFRWGMLGFCEEMVGEID